MMRTIWSFLVRLSSGLRRPIGFATDHPKKVEAIGLCILLLAAAFQLAADYALRERSSQNLVLVKYEIEFTRQKVMTLQTCMYKQNCMAADFDQVMTELPFFPSDPWTRLWELLRYAAFIVGSILVLVGKWHDGKPLEYMQEQ